VRKGDIAVVQHNPDPSLHPFERAIEYQRALNATKLDKVFAKPFIAALDEHKDGVFCLERHPSRVSTLLSGSCDGG
jgi:DDB1- and CUL4-associated factor 13